MQEGAWALAFLDLPDELMSNPELLGDIETMLAIARRINADLDIRERFHLQNVMVNPAAVADELPGYARILIYPLEDLLTRITAVDVALDVALR